jgi:hypothetical protein
MAKLFTASHAAKSVIKTANAETMYNELLAKAKSNAFKPNSTLVRTVNTFDRLVKSALKHGTSLQELFSKGFFDATLDEYRAQCKKENADATKLWIASQKERAQKLESLGKPMEDIYAYFDGMHKDLVLPMQAMEAMMAEYFGNEIEFKGAKLIAGTYGNDHKAKARHEFQRSKAINDYISAYKATLVNPKGTVKRENADSKLNSSQRLLESIGYKIECKNLELPDGKFQVSTSVTSKALPSPKIKTKKQIA